MMSQDWRRGGGRDWGRYRLDGGLSVALLVGSLVASAATAAATVVSSQSQANLVEEQSRQAAQQAEMQAAQAQQQAEAAAGAYGYNAAVATQEADQVRAAAALDIETARERGRRLQAIARAAVGASGVTSEGSPLIVMSENAAQLELEEQRIRYGAEVAATGQENAARLQSYYEEQARLGGQLASQSYATTGAQLLAAGSQQASNIRTGGLARAGTSLLTSGYSAASGYYASTRPLRVPSSGIYSY